MAFLSWVHFGDLHVQNAQGENYEDFISLVKQANRNLTGEVDFAFLPGDNADDGTELQYKLVRQAIDGLNIPTYTITGDHDKKSGSLDLFRQYLEPDLFKAVDSGPYRLLFLNALDGASNKDFDIGPEQMDWLRGQLTTAREGGIRSIVFMHLYPSELRTRAAEVSRLIRKNDVLLVEMGHTHYNELANDGHTIYATTRSTGQIEEGPPGFSLTTVDDGVVAWKFNEVASWPFAMITSPADRRLITDAGSSNQVVRGTIEIRARAWNSERIESVACSIDSGPPLTMRGASGLNAWTRTWDSSAVSGGEHELKVRVRDSAGRTAEDSISILVNQASRYDAPARQPVDLENAIGAYPAKGIPGTQLGPNKNGTKGPWPSWRKPLTTRMHLSGPSLLK